MNQTNSPPPAGLLRRLGGCLYDMLLLAALWMVATAAWLPFTGGEEIPQQLQPLFQLYLVVVAALFFAGFWCLAGQTLGMRAWHLRVQQPDGSRISLRQALIRLAVAPLSWAALGLGFIWILFDGERRAWHDIASGTAVVFTRPER